MIRLSEKKSALTADVCFIICITGMVFYAFMPNSSFLLRDDHFLLAERAYFDSNFGWLKHLLPFNQSRFTWTGDYMLFRPGLFFVNWLFDVCARHNRDLLHLISLACYSLSGIMLYLACRQYVRGIMAFALSGLFAVPRYSETLANWPHISPYLFSMILLIWGILTIKKSVFRHAGPRTALPVFLLFLSSLFHEYVVVALLSASAFLLIILLLTRRNRTLQGSNARAAQYSGLLIIFSAPLFLYMLLYLVNYLNFMPPSFYTADQNIPAVALKGFLFHYAAYIYKSVNFILPDITFKSADVYNAIWWFPAFVFFAAVAIRNKRAFRCLFIRNEAADPLAVISFSSILALLAGILFGRFIIWGGTNVWYVTLLGYFLLIDAALLWSLFADKIPAVLRRLFQAVFILLAMSTMLLRSAHYHSSHKEARKDIEPIVAVTDKLSDFFKRNRAYSYAGIFTNPADQVDILKSQLDLPFISNFSRSINLALYYCSSAVRNGTVLYARMNDSSRMSLSGASIDLCRMDTADRESADKWIDADLCPRQVFYASDTAEPPHALNIYEGRNKGAFSRRMKSLYLTENRFLFHELKIQFECRDEFPVMYNTAVILRGDSASTTVALVDNEIIVSYGKTWSTLTTIPAVTQGTLPDFPRTFSIVIRRNGPDFLVFMDEYLLTFFRNQDTFPVGIGIASWENGTPLETAVGAKILPCDSIENHETRFIPVLNIPLKGEVNAGTSCGSY